MRKLAIIFFMGPRMPKASPIVNNSGALSTLPPGPPPRRHLGGRPQGGAS
jgi:hypothetical protein